MSTSIEEHPEEALERALAGTLAPEEREPLERHLAVCLACKAHLALASAAQESVQPRPRDEEADRVNVDRALAFALRPAAPSRLRLRKQLFWPIAAALLALGGIAAAAWQKFGGPGPALEGYAVVVPNTAQPRGHKSAFTPAPSTEAEPEPESVMPAPVTPSAAATAATVANSATAANSAPLTAGVLFRKASALRANGEPDAAIGVFSKLQKLFPESRESRLSLVIAGRLLLERGRAAQALEAFDHYLLASGSASEDALAGRAAALQSLGRTDAEAGTWQRLLAKYPKSVYDKRAKARLLQLRPAQSESADSAGKP